MAIERPAPLGDLASETYAPIEEGLKAALLAVQVPTLSAVMFKRGLMSRFIPGIMPLNPNACRFCGAAFTIRAIPVREDLRAAIAAFQVPSRNRLAMDAAPAGSVVVCATGDQPQVSIMGDIITTALMTRGVAGVLLDTGVADAAFISTMPFPVFATGSAPISPFAAVMVVDHDTPVGVRGVAVFPGDIIVGDANGAVCIPRHLGWDVAKAAAETEQLEEYVLERIRAGASLDGVYPPNSATMADYRAWRDARAAKA